MPNCFQLTFKGMDRPMPLSLIDEQVCVLLREPVHDTLYCAGWFDIIGRRLAMGQSWSEIETACLNWAAEDYINGRLDDSTFWARLVRVCRFLEDNYESDAWAEIGRRP